jgi:phage tail sheath protein FI
MPTYLTPGVYYERIDATAPAITAIRTDVAGFVGIALRGPIDTAVPVQSWRQFQAHFGEFTGSGFLAYAVRAFFENGGRRCWVVRVASRDPNGGAMAAGISLQDSSGKDFWRIAASSPGAWGNDLSILLRETHRAQTLTDPKRSTPNASAVSSTSGFKRGTMVRLSQSSAPQAWKVVSDVDPIEERLIWMQEKPEFRLPYDSPVEGFDRDRPILIESVEYTLVVREVGNPIAIYEGLSLVPEHDNYGPGVLAPFVIPTDVQTQQTLPPVALPIVIEELRTLPLQVVEPIHLPPDATIPLDDGVDGLTLLTTYDFIGEDISPLDSDELKEQKRRGIRVLESVEEVSIVAVPDIQIIPVSIPAKAPRPPCIPDPCLPQESIPPATPRTPAEVELPPVFSEEDLYRVQAALVQHCEELRDRIALLDPPFSTSQDNELGVGAVRAWRSRFDSKYAAFYYPWLRVVDPLRSVTAITRDIPPCGHVAGQYARTDFEVGVHKAPANSPLVWTQDVTVPVNDAVHGVLNPLGINVIRVLPGRGIRIFGARTASSDPGWRYVNVRRLMMMIEKAVYLSTQWAVFEPNDVYTRAKLQLSLTSFLIALWQQGALVGSTTQEAFFVKCDEENNPARERDNGRLLAEVGVAPSNPFEFIVVRVGRADNEFEISELSMSRGGK